MLAMLWWGECGVEESIVAMFGMIITCLHFAIGPSWDLNDHIQDGLLLIGIERDIVEGRDGDAILFNIDSVLQGVGRTILPDRVA
jgi:hypothetical protein